MEENKDRISVFSNGIPNTRTFDATIPFDDGEKNIKYAISELFPKVAKIILVSNTDNIKKYVDIPSKHQIVIERNSREDALEVLEKIKKEIGRDVAIQETEPIAIQETELTAIQETEPIAIQETEPTAIQETEPTTIILEIC
jgi:hypothetical protein